MQQDEILTASEVASLLKLNVETIYTLIASQGLPAAKIGGQWRFIRSEVHEWLRLRQTSSQEGGRS